MRNLSLHKTFRVEQHCPGRFPIQVVDPLGLPHIELTIYANKASESLSPKSVTLYLGELIRIHSWAYRDDICKADNLTLLGNIEAIRRIIFDYLVSECKCVARNRRDDGRILNIFIRESDKTRVNVRLTLTALKHYYNVLCAASVYQYPNPLVSELLAERIKSDIEKYQNAHLKEYGRRSPRNSGGVDVAWEKGQRYSANYFQLVQGDWLPQAISNAVLPVLLYKAGAQHGWSLRERVIARMLFETGARINEVIIRSLGDWETSDCLCDMSAHDKGSHGVRVKTISFSTETANMLRRYFDGERAEAERGPLKSLAQFRNANVAGIVNAMHVPLFLSRGTGRAYSVSTFRDLYWRPALVSAGIQCQIHQARHWFVTRSIQIIDESSRDDDERIRKRTELVKYMAWRSGSAMLAVYDHSDKKIVSHISNIHNNMEQEERKMQDMSLDDLKGIAFSATMPPNFSPDCSADDDLNFIINLGTGGGDSNV